MTVDHDAQGNPCGSVIALDGLRWRLPSWPFRLSDVRPLDGGGVAVEFRDGSARLLEPQDAEP